jgi:hypothetical protein
MSTKNPVELCAQAVSPSRILSMIVLVLVLGLLASAHMADAHAASDETAGDTFPVSVTPAGVFAGGEGTAEYRPVSIAEDGRHVAFESRATNLGQQGPQEVIEAFVKDLHTGELELVSRADGAEGEPADEPGIENLELSGDGRYVIFTSAATNLVDGLPAEEAGEQHVYRRDLKTGETLLVDRASGAKGAIASLGAIAEAISRNGRYVVFSAQANDLEDAAGEHARTVSETVYVRDTQRGRTTAVSRANGAGGAIANEANEAFSISPDGRYVAFDSQATNLGYGAGQVYLRDLQAATTTLVSQNALGTSGDRRSSTPRLVGSDGCKVEFESIAFNLLAPSPTEISGDQVYLADVCSTPRTVTLVSQNEAGIAGDASGVFGASADAARILFSGFFQGPGTFDLFLRDPATGQTTQIDRAGGASGVLADHEVQEAAISANGCRAVFASQATNLLGEAGPPEEANGETPTEVYVRQLAPCHEEPAVSPSRMSFGPQALGTLGAPQSLTVTAGSEALQIGRLQMSGTDATDFIVTGDECTGEVLQPEERCAFMVRFVPSATGDLSATLTVRTDDDSLIQATLTGKGTQSPSGDKGSQGESGEAGVSGPAGQRGPAGLKGAKGARGAAGRDAKVRCRAVRHTHKVVCEVNFKGKRPVRGARARLTMAGHLYASGPASRMRTERPVRPGNYTLHFVLAGRELVVAAKVRISG